MKNAYSPRFTDCAVPATRVENIREVLHGVEVVDPYRWLEDQTDPRTRIWLQEQAQYCRAYFDSVPCRDKIRGRVSQLLTTDVVSLPSIVNGRLFLHRRKQADEQIAIIMRTESGAESVLVDPLARFGPGKSVAITALSSDGTLLAFAVREGGTDHAAIEICDVETGRTLEDRLPEGFCYGFAFATDNSGFYYAHHKLSDPDRLDRVLFHRFGDPFSKDTETFRSNIHGSTTVIVHSETAKLLLYVVSTPGKRRRTWIYLQTEGEHLSAKLLLAALEGQFVPFFVRDRLFALTDIGGPSRRIVAIDIENASTWREVVGRSSSGRIRQFAVAGNRIFVSRTHRFSTRLEFYTLDGTLDGEVPLTEFCTVSLFNSPHSADKALFSYTTIEKPSTVLAFDPKKRTIAELYPTGLRIDPRAIAVEEVEYPSKDGTKIPMFLAGRRDRLGKASLPTFLTGYGGFGSSVTPRFTAFTTFLIERGFLVAVAALRGGSELGEEWHRAGMLEKRQNAFDDYVAGAEWLVRTGRSAAKRIAIGGGSNAGLLVGAVITQRPDLFRAAICLGPLLDMVRYSRFDRASRWLGEYGSPGEERDFRWLLAYSPYHHIRPGEHYPAVMLISGDADVRCNPMHARKMAARLQSATASGHPVLLDYKPLWGHMPVQPLSIKIESLTDRLAFACHELVVNVSDGDALC